MNVTRYVHNYLEDHAVETRKILGNHDGRSLRKRNWSKCLYADKLTLRLFAFDNNNILSFTDSSSHMNAEKKIQKRIA